METDTPQQDKQTERRALIPAGPRGIELHSLNDFYRFAEYVVAAGAVPAGINGLAGVIIALQRGAEVGLLPMQSLQSIYVVNNMPQLFGDAPKGIVLASGLMEKCEEFTEGTYPQDSFMAVCIVKRRGYTEKRSEFSIADAKTADLWNKKTNSGKPSPWVLYPKRMLRWRALGYALRDEFSDVLKGFPIRELLDDADNAFEQAKPAQGRIVEPRFEASPNAPGSRDRELGAQTMPEPEKEAARGQSEAPMAKRGPGRPRKAAEKTELFDPPKTEPVKPPEPEPAAPPAEPGFGPEPEFSRSAREVLHRLQADNLELANFIKFMQRNAYAPDQATEISEVENDGLIQALQQWPKVVEHLKEMQNDQQRPFA